MNVTCEGCGTTYRVDPAKVPSAGVRARCSTCDQVFWVRVPAATALAAAPAVPGVAALVTPAPVMAAPPVPSIVVAEPVSPMAAAASAPETPPMAAADASESAPALARPAFGAVPMRPPMAPSAPADLAPPAAAVADATRVAPPVAAAPPVRAGAATSALGGILPPGSFEPPPRPVVPAAPTMGSRPVNPFLQQDPAARARRLARALVSDMVTYHPAKKAEGQRDGTLKQLFEEEIRRSWEEYADQVGAEIADGTQHFRDALNDILADGRLIF